MPPKQVMISVGEPSGDLHAARLLAVLNQRNNAPDCFGMGGARMRQQGFNAIVGIEQMAVMGLVEIIRHFPMLYGVLQQMRTLLKVRKPDLLILVDYPGFNLLLAKTAKQLGIPVLYYISPKIWVWRESRIHKIAKRVDHMALIFPFEQPYYDRVGVPATYVGHPLVGEVSCEESVETARKQLGLDPNRRTVGLFPGSRRGEVTTLLPELLESARQLTQQDPEVQFLLSQAPELPNSLFESAETFNGQLYRIKGDAHRAIHACDAIVTASGTVTLEIALLNRPMVVVYRMAPLSYAILSRLIKTRWVSLVNIVAQREVVPELLQEQASATAILQQLQPLLEQSSQQTEMLQGLEQVRTALGEGDSSARLASLVEEMIV
ncbi:MAG: lipid-A-disaccharide synthase [Gammaproteobacteria bacterium]|nr:lipid-A-disaccharide synthase [Gammaproteobacteria bacterium]MBT3490117.1 lipid-A-disaccharide synthase [Gammaproteobacteria bacterium]MBT3844393.1 lipid-A-disaccharide synthase [Gammaproteobacteria bacterium]MBT3892590.1 lipid-A-disaccharide synthase [Gammaproteobacteria bacterium]MBT4299725.1 lipid-A-disaccharide synthase [Gammaproteobacteria bacterium]